MPTSSTLRVLPWVAAGLVALALAGATAGALQARRQGRTFMLAQLTADVIGLGLALGAAFGGAVAAAVLLRQISAYLSPAWVTGVQVAAGLVTSYLVSLAFDRWLRWPLRDWLSGEGQVKGDG